MRYDTYRQISYLGNTVTFVDVNLHFHKFAVSYRNFPVDLSKTGENMSKVRLIPPVRNQLINYFILDIDRRTKKYGIEKFESVCRVNERESNFMRCFNINMAASIFCFSCRIHNALTIILIDKKMRLILIMSQLEVFLII